MKPIRFLGIFLVCLTLFLSTSVGAEVTKRELTIENRAEVDAHCAYAYLLDDEDVRNTEVLPGFHVEGWVHVPSGRAVTIDYTSNYGFVYVCLVTADGNQAQNPVSPLSFSVPKDLREDSFHVIHEVNSQTIGAIRHTSVDKKNLETKVFSRKNYGGESRQLRIGIPGPVEIKMEAAVEIIGFAATELQVMQKQLKGLQAALAHSEAARNAQMKEMEHLNQIVKTLKNQLNVLQKHPDPKFDGVYDTRGFVRHGKDYALLFATNTYQHWGGLDTPINDAEAIGSELEKYGFAVDIRKNVKTRADILNTLMEYAQKDYQPGDQLFVYFAGHGNFSEEMMDGYIATSNSELPKVDPAHATCLSYAALERYLDRLACPRILLVLDVDYGGTFDDTIALGPPTKDNISTKKEVSATGNQRRLDLAETLKVKTRWYVTAGGKQEVEDGLGRNSPFAKSLLKVLKITAGNDGVLTVPELEEALPEIYRSELDKLEKVYKTEIKLEPISGSFGSGKASDKAFVFIKSQI